MMVAAFLFPAYLFLVGVALPLGLIPSEGLAYGRILELASSLVGRILVLTVVSLPLWAGAHHIRHIFIDFGAIAWDVRVSLICYGLAGLGSFLALIAVVRL